MISAGLTDFGKRANTEKSRFWEFRRSGEKGKKTREQRVCASFRMILSWEVLSEQRLFLSKRSKFQQIVAISFVIFHYLGQQLRATERSSFWNHRCESLFQNLLRLQDEGRVPEGSIFLDSELPNILLFLGWNMRTWKYICQNMKCYRNRNHLIATCSF